MDHDLVHVSCADEKCGHTICLRREVYDRVRTNRETVRCPAGHGNWWPDYETDDEKEIKKLKEQINSLRKVSDWFDELLDDKTAQIYELRLAARTCPICGTRFRWRTRFPERMHEHLVEAHGAQVPEVLPEPGNAPEFLVDLVDGGEA